MSCPLDGTTLAFNDCALQILGADGLPVFEFLLKDTIALSDRTGGVRIIDVRTGTTIAVSIFPYSGYTDAAALIAAIQTNRAACFTAGGGGGGTTTVNVDHFQTNCMCDDVDGDGSNIVKYNQVVKIDTNGVATIVSNYTEDWSATYTPQNPATCSSLGVDAAESMHRTVLSNGTWTMPAMTTKVRIHTVRVGDAANRPTVLDSDNDLSELHSNVTEQWSTTDSSYNFLKQPFNVVSADSNDIIIINYTRLNTI